jgi:hypothetical protein
MKDTITLCVSPGIPPGFSIAAEQMEGDTVHFLQRTIDKRRRRITWTEGSRRYTAKELSQLMFEDADADNPLLNSLL